MSSRRKDGKKRKKGLIQSLLYADVAELADAQVSGSCGNPVQVQLLSSAPYQNNTNQDDKPRFVLFFARDFFGAIVRLDQHL